MNRKIIITGANGQLGNCLRDLSREYPMYDFIFTDVDQLDITNKESVAQFFETQKPNWVINAAAFTAVDRAESDRDIARLINATAVGFLATQSSKVGSGFVHISTDYVFDGKSQTILTEDMPTNPQSLYGESKLEGEELTRQNPQHIILRTSWLYSTYGNNFVKTMRRLGGSQGEVSVVCDQWGSPTSADDLALAILTAISKADSGAEVYGLYHFSNEGSTCWADFAQQIMDLSSLDCTVKSITTDQYPTPAARPAFSVMSKAKFSKTFDAVIPEWELSLEKVIERLDKEEK